MRFADTGLPCHFFYQAGEASFLDVEITQKHRTKGKSSATTFFVECVGVEKDEFIAVATVMWADTGAQVEILECEPAPSAPTSVVDAFQKLSS